MVAKRLCITKCWKQKTVNQEFYNIHSDRERKLRQPHISRIWKHFFYFLSFIFISWRLITLQYCSGFCHTLTRISHGFTCIPHPDPPSHLPLHSIPLGLPSAPALSTCLICIQLGLVICFTLDNIYVSVLFSRNIPTSPSPTESKSLFYTSVSHFLICISGYHYHLSKFHIYVLVYCIGVYLYGLLHSV